ncbi:hypothetical protein Tco_0244485, partial [Tanacetum coccineum]
IEIGREEGLLNAEVLSNEELEENEYGNPSGDSFPNPFFDKDKNNHNENNRDVYKSSNMGLSGAPESENIKQPNEEAHIMPKDYEEIRSRE